jgi:hypothetical protein
VPPKLTAVIPEKLLPLMVMVSPMVPDKGEKPLTTDAGGGIKIKPARLPVPLGDVTETNPEPPFPTTAVIVVAFTTVKELAGMPPKLTEVVPVKIFPLMVTVLPLVALAGEKLLIIGIR